MQSGASSSHITTMSPTPHHLQPHSPVFAIPCSNIYFLYPLLIKSVYSKYTTLQRGALRVLATHIIIPPHVSLLKVVLLRFKIHGEGTEGALFVQTQ